MWIQSSIYRLPNNENDSEFLLVPSVRLRYEYLKFWAFAGSEVPLTSHLARSVHIKTCLRGETMK